MKAIRFLALSLLVLVAAALFTWGTAIGAASPDAGWALKYRDVIGWTLDSVDYKAFNECKPGGVLLLKFRAADGRTKDILAFTPDTVATCEKP